MMPRGTAEIVFTARPDMRRARLRVALWGAALVIVFTLYYGGIYLSYHVASFYYPPERMEYDPLIFHFFGIMSCFVPAGMLVTAVGMYLALASTRYTVTTEHVEVRGGIVNRYTRLIPLGSVRDVSTLTTFDQRLLGLGDVQVVASNGDARSLQDVPAYEAKRDAIWSLVRK